MIKKLYLILSSKERIMCGYFLILSIITSLLDVLGIASILPFMSLIINPDIIYRNFYLNKIYELVSVFGLIKTELDFLFLFGILVLIIFTISLIFRALTNYFQVRFALMREFTISKRLLDNYLHQSYEWFLTQNNSDLSKNVLSETSEVLKRTLVPLLNLFVYSTVIFAIFILLIIIDPFLSIIIITSLGFSYGLIFFLFKKFLNKIGNERFNANKERYKYINEIFNAIGEIKLRGIENFYLHKYSYYAKIFSNSQSLALVIAKVPKFFLEGIMFGGIIVVCLFLIYEEKNFSDMIPLFSLYIFAGYRVMPALQNVYTSYTEIQFVRKGLDSIYKDLKKNNFKVYEKQFNSENVVKFEKVIELKNVSFSYSNFRKTMLHNIDLTIPVCSTFAVIGPTGSGKTTLINILLGLLEPTEGILMVDNVAINKDNKRHWQRHIGYVPQFIYFKNDTIRNNIAFGCDENLINDYQVKESAKLANIDDFIENELPDGYHTIIGERGMKISGGQSQRIGIARAIYHNPKLLILDESTSSLDNLTEKKIIENLRSLKKNTTIIKIAHRLNSIKDCDKIIFIEKGKIIASGNYQYLIENNEKFKTFSQSELTKNKNENQTKNINC